MAWASIDPDGPQLAVGAARAEYGLTKQVPGMNIKPDGIWRAPLSWPAYVALREVFSRQPLLEYEPLQAWAADRWEEVRQRWADKVALDAPEPLRSQLIAMEDGGDLHLSATQRAHVHWLLRWRRDILGDPRGNGKTPPLIRALQLLNIQGEGCPALIICPGAAMRAWKRKLEAWAPELRVQIVGGTALKRRAALERDADVYIIAWPNVRLHTRLAMYPGKAFVRCDEHGGTMGKTQTQCEVCEKELNARRWRVVIADEAHRMADAGSKQARAVWHLAHHAETFWPVTGTLTPKNMSDPWAIMHAIDPRGWPDKGRYLNLYAEQAWGFGNAREILGLRADTADSFHLSFGPWYRSVPKEIARPGDPPLLEPEFLYPPMEPAQRKLYRELAKQMLAELTDGDLVPDNTAVKHTRLVQLASSSIILGETEDKFGFAQEDVVLTLPSNKADCLLEFLGDNPGQWIVACDSPFLAALAEHKLKLAGISSGRIIGGMSYDATDQVARQFCSKDFRVIFVTAAGSEAIDLYAEGIIWLRPTPSWVFRDQMNGRADRWGAASPVRQVVMMSPGTVDFRLWELGEQKQERHERLALTAETLRWMLEAGQGDDDLDSPIAV